MPTITMYAAGNPDQRINAITNRPNQHEISASSTHFVWGYSDPVQPFNVGGPHTYAQGNNIGYAIDDEEYHLDGSGTVTSLTFQTDDPFLIVEITGLNLSVSAVLNGILSPAASAAAVRSLIDAGSMIFNGSAGNDTIAGGVQADEINGNSGNDAVAAGDGADTVNGDAGNDSLDAGSGADTVSGGSGDDTIDGGTDNDLLYGDLGNDTFFAGAGNDTMHGGAGNDIYNVTEAGDQVVEAASEGYDHVLTTLNTYTLGANVERVTFFGAGNFVGLGNTLDNRFSGNAGDDRFVTSTGGDIYSGGMGTDAVDYRTSATGAVVNFATSTFSGAAAGDSFSSIESFYGSQTAGDAFTGTGTGKFTFLGYGGNDTLTGADNIDKLQGEAGNDQLSGLGGVDTLLGEAGNDTLTGGAGTDYFAYAAGGFGQDSVTDFTDGVDRLRFSIAVVDDTSDFSIAGNGTTTVTLTLVAAPTNSITLTGAAAITITAADFVFY